MLRPAQLPLSAALLLLLAACGGEPEEDTRPLVASGVGSGRLSARPTTPATRDTTFGLYPLEVNGEKRGVVLLPQQLGQADAAPAPLMLLLHYAGGSGNDMVGLYFNDARADGVIVVAPTSVTGSWDVHAQGAYGPDLAFIDAALAQVFSRYAVDPERVVVAGYSAGASYALSLGLTNGDLFRRVIAFAPEEPKPSELVGKPPVFLTHGTRDESIPVEQSREHTVPRLRREGYEVDYREFDGGHDVDPALAYEAWDLFVGRN